MSQDTLNSRLSIAHCGDKGRLKKVSFQSGQGFVSGLQNFGAWLTEDKAHPKNRLYPNEKHTLIYNTTLKRYEPAQFMGPGTEYLRRSRAGQQGLSQSDTAAKAHDIRYALGTSNADIKAADTRFYTALDRASRSGGDVPFNINQGRLLKIKDFIPGIGSTFGDKNLTEQDREYLRGELAKLSAKGYGKRRPRKRSVGQSIRITRKK